METLAAIIIVFLVCVEAYCITWLYQYCKSYAQRRADAKRAATRPRIYKEVHDKWEIERNRRKLWSSIEK